MMLRGPWTGRAGRQSVASAADFNAQLGVWIAPIYGRVGGHLAARRPSGSPPFEAATCFSSSSPDVTTGSV
jgi:hypothetical protein